MRSTNETFSGLFFDPTEPTGDMINILDIAHGLSKVCRYVGQCSRFYSVAEHSFRVASLVPKNMRLQALLHDAAEAYLCDLPSPLKQLPELEGYRKIEARVQGVIFEKFGVRVTPGATKAIKRADEIMCATEARILMRSRGRGWNLKQAPLMTEMYLGLSPEQAWTEFMRLFYLHYRP